MIESGQKFQPTIEALPLSFRDKAALAALPVIMAVLYEESKRTGLQFEVPIADMASAQAYEVAAAMIKAREA